MTHSREAEHLISCQFFSFSYLLLLQTGGSFWGKLSSSCHSLYTLIKPGNPPSRGLLSPLLLWSSSCISRTNSHHAQLRPSKMLCPFFLSPVPLKTQENLLETQTTPCYPSLEHSTDFLFPLGSPPVFLPSFAHTWCSLFLFFSSIKFFLASEVSCTLLLQPRALFLQISLKSPSKTPPPWWFPSPSPPFMSVLSCPLLWTKLNPLKIHVVTSWHSTWWWCLETGLWEGD